MQTKKWIFIVLATFLCLCTGTFVSASSLSSEPSACIISNPQTETEQDQQIACFIKQLAQQKPTQVSTLLLSTKDTYLYDDTIIYIGIKGTDEVVVIGKIDDFEVGTFYHVAHKQQNRIFTDNTTTVSVPQDFITLFEREL